MTGAEETAQWLRSVMGTEMAQWLRSGMGAGEKAQWLRGLERQLSVKQGHVLL